MISNTSNVLEEQLKTISYRLDKQVHENSQLVHQVQQANEKKYSSDAELAKTKLDLQTLQLQTTQVTKQLKDVNQTFETQELSQKKKIGDLSQMLAQSQLSEKQVAQDFKLCNERLREKNKDIQNCECKVIELESQLQRITFQLESASSERLFQEKTLESALEECRKVKLENLQQSLQIQNLQTMNGQSKIAFESSLQTELKKSVHLKQKFEDQDREISELKRALQTKIQELNQREADTNIALSKAQSSVLKSQILEQEIDQLNYKVKEADYEQKQKNEFRKKMTAELQVVQEENARLNKAINELRMIKGVPTESQLHTLRANQVSYTDFPGKLQSIVQDNSDLQIKLAQKDKSLEESRSELDYTKQRCSKVELELQSIKKKEIMQTMRIRGLTSAIMHRQSTDAWLRCAQIAIRESPSYNEIEFRTNQILSQEGDQKSPEDQVDQLHQEIAKVQMEKYEIQLKHDEMQISIEQLRQKIVKQNDAFKLIHDKLKDDHRQEPVVKQYQTDIKPMQEQFQRLIEEKIKEIASLKTRQSELEQQLNTKKNVPFMTPISVHQVNEFETSHNQELQNTLKQKEQTLLHVLDKNKIMENTLQLLRQENSLWQAQVLHIINEQKALVLKEGEKQDALNQMYSQLAESVPAEKLTQAVNEVQKCQDVNKKMKDHIATLQVDQIKMNTQIDNCAIQINQLQRQLEKAQNIKNEVERTLGREIESLRSSSAQVMPSETVVSEQINAMIQQMSEQHKNELFDREQMITQLQEFISELDKQVKAQATEAEQKIQDLLDQHAQQMKSAKDSHLQTQVDNAELNSRIVEFQNQINVLRDREETLQFTGEIQSDEIRRMQNAPIQSAEIQQRQKILEFTQRIDKIQISSFEKEQIIAKLQSELDHTQNLSTQKCNLLEQEVNQFRSQCESLKSEVMTLKSHQQQNNLLKLIQKPTQADSSQQIILQLQEQVARCERDLEQIRLHLLQKQTQLKNTQDALNQQTFEKSKFEAELQNELAKSQFKEYQLKEREDLISQCKLLMSEKLELIKQLNQVSKLKTDLAESQKAVEEFKSTTLKAAQDECAKVKETLQKNSAVYKNQQALYQKSQGEIQVLKNELADKEEAIKKQTQNIAQSSVSLELHEELIQLKMAYDLLKTEVAAKGHTDKPQGQMQNRMLHSLMRAKNVIERIHNATVQRGSHGDDSVLLGQKRQRTD